MAGAIGEPAQPGQPEQAPSAPSQPPKRPLPTDGLPEPEGGRWERRCRRQPSRRTTHLRPHTTTTARRAGPGCWARIRIQHTVGLTKQEKTLAFRLQPTFFTYSLPETQIYRSIFQQPLPS